MPLIIGGHLLLSVIIAFIGVNRINKQERFANFCISLFFPVGGWITILILYLFKDKRIKEIDDETEEDSPVTLFAERVDMDKERNVVPLEEALLINDTKTKRQQLIDTLKKDFSQYVDMLKTAVRDDDVETSHYAAAAVTEIKRKLDLKIQEFSVRYEKEKQDLEIAKGYAGVLEEYIHSNLLDEINKKKVMFTFIHVLENILNSCPGDSKFYKILINSLLEAGEMDKAGEYCRVYLENCADEEAFLVNFKYFYLMKDKPSFDQLLKKLQSSNVRLTSKGVQVIRFWVDGV
ncbi:MAG: hypothetical protein RO469_13690 [Thermincola sp.]|nr:hypothetical protein [Thermincola sp.]MDT3704108.1 hypothetical protein [Thermincola sp.]